MEGPPPSPDHTTDQRPFLIWKVGLNNWHRFATFVRLLHHFHSHYLVEIVAPGLVRDAGQTQQNHKLT